MLDTETGEVVNLTLMHEGNNVREFYSKLPRPVLVGIKPPDHALFLNLMEELGNRMPGWPSAQIRRRNPANRNMTDATRT